MNNKSISKWFSMLLVMMVAGVSSAWGQSLTIDEFSLKPGDSKEVAIKLVAGQNAAFGIQTDIVLSEGLSLDGDPTSLVTNLEVFYNNQNGRIAQLSMKKSTTSATGIAAGEIIKLKVKASDTFNGGTITLQNTFIATNIDGSTEVTPEGVIVPVGVIITPADPVISPEAGTYYAAQQVTITCATDGAQIYYTTDGGDPTAEDALYASAFEITQTTTVKAIAILGSEKSAVVSATYTIEELKYYAVGVPGTIFGATGAEWNIDDANLLTKQNDGTYKIEYKDIAMHTGETIECKVKTNSGAWIPAQGDNKKFTAEADGTYDITIVMNAEATDIMLTVTKQEPPVEYTYFIVGPEAIFGINWGTAEANKLTKDATSGKYTWTKENVTINPAADIEYKIIRQGTDNSEVWIPAGTDNNLKCTITEAAIYKLAVSYDPDASSLEGILTATKSGEIVFPAAPTFSPAGGTYTEAQNVTIACETDGAFIYYTLDGTTPTASSTKYTTAIAVSKTTTIKAIAILNGISSEAVSATYTIEDAPTLEHLYIIGDMNGWALEEMPEMTLNTQTNAFEYNITNTDKYYFAISDVATATSWDAFKAHRYAIAAGDQNATIGEATQLQNVDGTIVINGAGKYLVSVDKDLKMTITKSGDIVFPAAPTFSPAGGTYTEAQNVTIACETDGAFIYYTLDGTTPTASSTKYTTAIAVSKTTTIKAIAILDGISSEAVSATYTINDTPVLEYAYYIVGPEAIFGVDWATDDANLLTKDATSGKYTWTKENVIFNPGDLEYKLIRKGITDNSVTWLPEEGGNLKCAITARGKYTLAVSFDPEATTLEGILTATLTEALPDVYVAAGAVIIDNVEQAGFFGTTIWDTSTENNPNEMTLANGVYTKVFEKVNIAAGTKVLAKVAVNGGATWYPERDNMEYVVNEAGVFDVTITFNTADNTATLDVAGKMGDANLNGKVNTSDAVLTVSFALEKETPTYEQKRAADINKNDKITVSDAVGIVNIALEIEDEPASGGAPLFNAGDNFLTLNGTALSLTNMTEFVAFQMDVTLANGAMLNGVQFAERAAGLNLYYNRISDNTWRIIGFSTEKNVISGNEGNLLTLDITGNKTVTITNVEFADANAVAYALGLGEATGISNISIDAAGAEIYTIDGRQINSLQKGLNIVKTADGQVRKVIVK